jgi:hypothetical protein
VIDGGGSLRCALVGGNLAMLAEKNGWAGIVVHGCIRDVDEINACNIGVRALAAMPVKSIKRGGGEQNLRISIAGVAVSPGLDLCRRRWRAGCQTTITLTDKRCDTEKDLRKVICMWIDTHCHLDASEFAGASLALAEAAAKSGVSAIVIPAVHKNNFAAVEALSQQREDCFCALGIHPCTCRLRMRKTYCFCVKKWLH